VAKLNRHLAQNNTAHTKHRLVSLRYNGGANAGHETFIDGRQIVTKQLPMAVAQDGATAVMTRGMVLHGADLLHEIAWMKQSFGGALPGKLIIDSRVPLVLDLHRARESVVNRELSGGRGSTGRGIGPAYESWYGRYPFLLSDLLADDWHDLAQTIYRFYEKQLHGFDTRLSEIPVLSLDPTLANGEQPVGSLKTFLQRLAEVRSALQPFIEPDLPSYLDQIWNDPTIPVVIEGAQGIGLDPYHGVYPDITSSRPGSRSIADATYARILPEEIMNRIAVMKTTYLSSVGTRTLPQIDPNTAFASWIQETFDERGRVTGRLRDIYPVSLPIAQYLRRAAGYTSLAPTHLDACTKDIEIVVVTHYTDAQTGAVAPYLPYQDALDRLVPHTVSFPGWDGSAVANARSADELPLACRRYLSFLSQTIGPITLATTGKTIEDWMMMG
jgi:adenylosuccinate synthase